MPCYLIVQLHLCKTIVGALLKSGTILLLLSTLLFYITEWLSFYWKAKNNGTVHARLCSSSLLDAFSSSVLCMCNNAYKAIMNREFEILCISCEV